MSEKNNNSKSIAPFPSFEELFSDLIAESKSFTIEYKHSFGSYKEHDYIDFSIVSVNGYKSSPDFYVKITGFYKTALNALREAIKTFPVAQKVDFLTDIKYSLDNLKEIVSDDVKIDEESEFGPREEHDFKKFKNAIIRGTYPEHEQFHMNYILYKASGYAEIWFEEIDVTISKIDFLITNFELLPEMFVPQPAVIPFIKDKIKTNLSVDELAYLFKLLADEKIFDIPEGKAESYYKFIAENFSSKQKDEISEKSLKNKYLTPNVKTADSWHGRFIQLTQKSHKDKENL